MWNDTKWPWESPWSHHDNVSSNAINHSYESPIYEFTILVGAQPLNVSSNSIIDGLLSVHQHIIHIPYYWEPRHTFNGIHSMEPQVATNWVSQPTDRYAAGIDKIMDSWGWSHAHPKLPKLFFSGCSMQNLISCGFCRIHIVCIGGDSTSQYVLAYFTVEAWWSRIMLNKFQVWNGVHQKTKIFKEVSLWSSTDE